MSRVLCLAIFVTSLTGVFCTICDDAGADCLIVQDETSTTVFTEVWKPCELLENGLGNCIRKCCPINYVYNMSVGCSPGRDILAEEGLKVFSGRVLKKIVPLPISGLRVGVMACSDNKHRYLLDEEMFLQSDGSLKTFMQKAWSWDTQSLSLLPENYCLETFVDDDSEEPAVDALVCAGSELIEENSQIWQGICLLISCMFILATLIVYGCLPELRNVHGRVLMSYLSCLLLGNVMLIVLMFKPKQELCYLLGILIYFTMTAAFFWLNVMCFDIYWTFSGRRGLSRLLLRDQFLVYCAYAFGSSVLLTTLLLALEHSGIKHPYMPNFRERGCFLFGKSKLIYFYGPMIILCVVNITFFVMTAWRIIHVKRQTSVLRSGESALHDQQRSENDKQRLLLYIKLFIVMGVNWIFEVISSFFDSHWIIFDITDTLNMLIGVTIFSLFVCKKKIYKLIKNRFINNSQVQDYKMRHLSRWKWKNKDAGDIIDPVQADVGTSNVSTGDDDVDFVSSAGRTEDVSEKRALVTEKEGT